MSFGFVQTRRVPFCSQCGTDNPDVAKFCFACGAALVTAPPPQEFRKTVTIVFSDLKGSTAMGEKLDSESLREVMTRYFDAMRAEVEQHGGVVEKFIGDAIMAVFGLPKLHEDDALRAVRAAAGMQRAQELLNDELERHWGVRLTVRTGVNTGEVVAGDPTSGQRLVTGDAVNVAARLEQAAGAQEVLLGDLTYRLVRDYVEVEPVEPLELKGKSQAVAAYRLVGVRDDIERPRRLDAPMVGRDRELEVLHEALTEATSERACRLVTVVGEAGVGKSRLIDEFVRSVEGEASFLRGRCLPYGDGITFWPLAEAVRQAAGILERDTTDDALTKLSALSGDADAEARIASAIGLAGGDFPVEELFWGARKLLESLARPRPLLVLFEDIHWAETTFLELVENVLATARDAPLLVVCTARHELIERLPTWSTETGAVRIELQRLSEDEAAAVAEHLLGRTGLDRRVRARVVAAAEGNPLFVEQLVSMLIDEGLITFESGCWRAGPDIDRAVVPPTIHALLAARLDYLEADERIVIEPAAVIGQLFAKDAVVHLVPERVRDDVGHRLGSLTDKQLVHPDLSRSLEEEAFRFHHVLIRDTAYEGILKRARATYHEHFVQWADSVNREGATEYEEINGYHLEQAYCYLSELGPLDDHGRAIGADAARRLASAAQRARSRGDIAAAANLLERATNLLPEDAPERLAGLPDLGEILIDVGRFADAEVVLDAALLGAEAIGDRRLTEDARLRRLLLELRTGEQELWSETALPKIREAIDVFSGFRDDAGLAVAYRMLGYVHGTACNYGEAAVACERAMHYARALGDAREERLNGTSYALALCWGPTPVQEATERLHDIHEQASGSRLAQSWIVCLLAHLRAMTLEFDEARQLLRGARAAMEDLQLPWFVAWSSLSSGRIETLAGDHAAAERELRHGVDLLEQMDERYLRSTLAALLARALVEQDRVREADELTRQAEELAGADDVETQATWRAVKARIVAQDGLPERAAELAPEVLQLLLPTDSAVMKVEALGDLGEALARSGEEGSAWMFSEAIKLAEVKGDLAAIGRLQASLRRVAPSADVEQAPV
jgi:class 3 adenylate cyclase/tetratricopeptide (TPR) repeat protein